jgi:zinc/manganese transport system ATP-binding protein
MSVDSVIRLREAAAKVGDRQLWHDVTVDVAAGEFVAVLGPNGVGKSTLVKVLLGLHPAAAGSVQVLDGAPGQHNDEIGYLPQRRNFDSSLRVRGIDLVRLGLDGDRWGLPLNLRSGARRLANERIAEVLHQVGAAGYAHRPVGQLSGGEQQRLLIAQALVRRPRLLILDEPLDSLDLPNQSAVAALLQDICRNDGVTVLIVAHDINPILGYLDQVIYLAGGGIAVGPPREVIQSETLSRLYGAPVEVLQTGEGRLVVVGVPEAPAHHTDRHGH